MPCEQGKQGQDGGKKCEITAHYASSWVRCLILRLYTILDFSARDLNGVLRAYNSTARLRSFGIFNTKVIGFTIAP